MGRLLVPPGAAPGDAEGFYGAPQLARVSDYSPDGVRLSLEASLRRLRLDRIDLALIHDPDDHAQEALEGAYPALAQLRSEGVIGAIGIGMNRAELLEWFLPRTDLDCVLIAGRYTLLDTTAASGLLPECQRRGIGVLAGGVFNSGIVADPRPGARYDYRAASATMIGRAQQIRQVCTRYGLPIGAVALQFTLRHPAVTAAVIGARSPAEIGEDVGYLGIHRARLGVRRARGLRAYRGPRRRCAVIVDAHHHVWDPRTARHAWLDELPLLNRPFSLADFEQASAAEGVTASVLVQVLPSVAETEEFLALADSAAGRVAGVVGWADLTSKDIGDELARLRSLPGGNRLVGIRHLVQDEPNADWLLRPAVRRGLAAVGAAGLVYDLLIRPRQHPPRCM